MRRTCARGCWLAAEPPRPAQRVARPKTPSLSRPGPALATPFRTQRGKGGPMYSSGPTRHASPIRACPRFHGSTVGCGCWRYDGAAVPCPTRAYFLRPPLPATFLLVSKAWSLTCCPTVGVTGILKNPPARRPRTRVRGFKATPSPRSLPFLPISSHTSPAILCSTRATRFLSLLN